MALGDVPLGQNDVIALNAADCDFSLVEVETTLFAALFRDRDREHRRSA
jgi:hypothetical protein